SRGGSPSGASHSCAGRAAASGSACGPNRSWSHALTPNNETAISLHRTAAVSERTWPGGPRNRMKRPFDRRTHVRRLCFRITSTRSRLASASGFSGGRVTPGHRRRTATVKERTSLPASSTEPLTVMEGPPGFMGAAGGHGHYVQRFVNTVAYRNATQNRLLPHAAQFRTTGSGLPPTRLRNLRRAVLTKPQSNSSICRSAGLAGFKAAAGAPTTPRSSVFRSASLGTNTFCREAEGLGGTRR